jgi:hypothetical protein
MFHHQLKRYSKLVVAMTMVMTASSAQSVDIKLDGDVNVRSTSDSSMAIVGLLKRGSIVSIPDDIAVKVDGKIDLKQTLNKWQDSQTANGPRKSSYRDGSGKAWTDTFFPIKFVKPAPGSSVPKGAIQPYLALKYMASQGMALVVNADAPIAARESDVADKTTTAEVIGCNGNCGQQPTTISKSTADTVKSVVEATQKVEPTKIAMAPVSPPKAAAAQPAPTGDYYYPQMLPRGLSASCQNFIKSNGDYGPWGQIVRTEINRYGGKDLDNVYMNPDKNIGRYKRHSGEPSQSITTICPNFYSFTPEQKMNFWVYTYAALANAESNCDPKRPASPGVYNPNGVAIGLFQMELSASLRRSKDRSYGGNYCAGNITSPGVNIRCSAKVMEQLLLEGKGLYAKNIRQVWEKQYWGPFQANSSRAKSAISQYRLCR